MGWSDFVRTTGFAGWSSLAARQPHKLKVDGSNPSLATTSNQANIDQSEAPPMSGAGKRTSTRKSGKGGKK